MNIYKYNSYYEVTEVQQNTSLFNKIDWTFSCFNFKTKTRYGRLYLNIGETIRIPSTVSEEFLREIIPKEPIDRQTDAIVQDNFYKMTSEPRNDIQERATDFLIGEGVHKVLSLNTNAGKTFITINAISKMKINAIVLVDTINLGEQWIQEIRKHTNAKNIQLIDADMIERDLVEDANIFIVTQQSIDSLMLRNYNKINEFMKDKQIGIKVFDESHSRFHELTRINNIFNTSKTIYLTATFDRNYTEVSQWKKVFSGVDRMIEKTEERYREINLVRFNTGPSERDVNYVVGLRGASSTLWAKVVLNKEKRLRRHILAPVIDTVINKYTIRPSKTRPLCIIVPLNEMCYKLQEYYKGKGYTVGVYNAEESKNKTTKEIFNNQIILTNSAMFSKGIDIPKLKWLINFNSVSSLIALEQVVGRLRGSESDEDHKVYIDCIDMSYGDGFIKQQKIRKRYYKKITTDEELLKEKNVFIIE